MNFKSNIEASIATTSDSVYPVPEGLTYEPYQVACIDYCMDRVDTLIADPPGLGKTIEAIGVANAMKAKSVLIVCPATLKGNWLKEWNKWASTELKVTIAEGKNCNYDVDVIIINYDIMDRHVKELSTRHWDLLICDESHMVKNGKAKRTRYILGGKINRDRHIPIQASKRLFLTGTPMLSRPVDLWTTIEAFDKGGLGQNYMKFAYRYCNAWKSSWGFDVSGAANLDELQEKLRSTFMIRREKKVLNLPPKRRQIIELPKKGLARLVQQELTVVQQNLGSFEKILGIDTELKEGLDEARELQGDDYETQGTQLEDTEQVGFEDISRVRRELAVAKLPMVIDHLDRLLESEDKLIVFIHHKEVAEKLAEKYGAAAVVVTGGVLAKDATDRVYDFQNRPGVKLMIGNILSAGKGHTMTAASTVVFAELSWVPGDMEQAEDRAWRYGQTNNVLIYHLVVEDSLDSKMVRKLIQKQEVISKSLDHVYEKESK